MSERERRRPHSTQIALQSSSFLHVLQFTMLSIAPPTIQGTRDGPDLGSSRTLERYHASTSSQSSRRTESFSQNAAYQHSMSDDLSRSSSNSLVRASIFAFRAASRDVPRRSERSSSFQRVGTGTASSSSLTYSVQGFGRPARSSLSEDKTRWTRRNKRMS